MVFQIGGTKKEIVESYELEVVENEIYITEQVNNILFESMKQRSYIEFAQEKYSNGETSLQYFDECDEDWPCDEITDFDTRTEPFTWNRESKWDCVLEEVSSVLKTYLKNGMHADVLKSRAGVGVGFVDGNIEILYIK